MRSAAFRRLAFVSLSLGQLTASCGADVTDIKHSAPLVVGLSPAAAFEGDIGFVLSISGSGFIRESLASWNGRDRPTTYVSPTELRAVLRDDDLAVPGTGEVAVFNPPPGGGTSNAIQFTIQILPLDRITQRVARDIITYNQAAQAGAAFRKPDVISRWELPVPVLVEEGVSRQAVIDALEHWKQRTGITYLIIADDNEPRLRVRSGTDGLGGALARGLVDGTYDNNRARSGLVVIRPDAALCTGDCRHLFRHELGHAIGFFDHLDERPSVMGGGSIDLIAREAYMIEALYSLPHGAKVELDGSWRVVLP